MVIMRIPLYICLLSLPLTASRNLGAKLKRFNSKPKEFCGNFTCSSDFKHLAETAKTGESCISCTQCYKNNYRFCMRVPKEKLGSPFCLCHHDIPRGCALAHSSDDSSMALHSVCRKIGVNLKQPPPPEVEKIDEKSIRVLVPNFHERDYWKTLDTKDFGIKILYNKSSDEHCERDVVDTAIQNYQCTAIVEFKEIERNPESPHKLLQISKDSIPTNIKGSFKLGYFMDIEEKRQMFFSREKIRIENENESMHSEFIQVDHFYQSEEPIVAGGGGNHGTVAAVLIVLGLLIAGIIAVSLFLKRKERGPFAKHKEPGYQFTPQNDITFPIKSGTLTKNSPLLQESTPEIQEFRDLLAECPMLISPKIDVKESIGNGHFGLIHKGVIVDAEQDALVHLARSPFRMSIETMREFLHEFGKTVAAAQHPNILGLIGVCDQDESMLICVEFCGGPNLQTLLRESRTIAHFPDYAEAHQTVSLMSSKRLFNIMLGLARALCHLEEKKVVHPCISAISVLIGQGGTPKLSGLGFSRLGDLYMRETEKKHSPLRWLAPESLTGESGENETGKSQIWSFGVLLWEVATLGGTPYPDLDTFEVTKHVGDGELILPQPPYCSDMLYKLMCECWSMDPSQRPTGMDNLRELQDLSLHPNEHIDLSMKENFKYHIALPLLEQIPMSSQ